MVVTVETDIGITGIGEGGAKDTLEQCAGTLIGKNPFQIDAIWQETYIAWFYPPGREKTHALGALDLALWDIKGKALGVPVHELLGGSARDYCECYATGGRHAAGRAGRRATEPERAREGDDGGRIPRVPHGRGRAADRRRLRHALNRAAGRAGLQGRARGGRARRRLVHRFPPAVRLQRRASRVPGDRGVRAVLRRRSGARRERAAGHPEAPADDDRSADRMARSGDSSGTSTGWSRTTTSITSARRCRTSAASPR